MLAIINFVVGGIVILAALVLWQRRHTWASRWDRPATLSIALAGVMTLFAWPLSGVLPGHLLYRVTGCWNLEDLVAHVMYLFLLGALVTATVGRLGTEQVARVKIMQAVYYPLTVIVPLLTALFLTGRATREYRALPLQIELDVWLVIYWLVLAGAAIHLSRCALMASLVLRRDPRNRLMATFYALFCVGVIVASLAEVAAVVVPRWSQTGVSVLVVGVLVTISGVLLLVAHTPLVLRRVSRGVEHPHEPEAPRSPEGV